MRIKPVIRHVAGAGGGEAAFIKLVCKMISKILRILFFLVVVWVAHGVITGQADDLQTCLFIGAVAIVFFPIALTFIGIDSIRRR